MISSQVFLSCPCVSQHREIFTLLDLSATKSDCAWWYFGMFHLKCFLEILHDVFVWRHAYVDEIVYVWSQHDLRLSILTNVDQRRTDLAGAQSCVLCLWFQSFAEKSAAILASIDRAISYIHHVLWRARDSCWLLEYDQAIQLFSMEVCIGDIHAGRPADHQINRFQILPPDCLSWFLAQFPDHLFRRVYSWTVFHAFLHFACGADSCPCLSIEYQSACDPLVGVDGVLYPRPVELPQIASIFAILPNANCWYLLWSSLPPWISWTAFL